MEEAERSILIESAVGGDSDALQRLIVDYHDMLGAAIERAMDASLRHRLDADDVLQEAYVAAFKSIAGCAFDGPAGFYKWLEKIALNRLNDEERGVRRRKRDVHRERRDPAGARTSYPDLVGRLASPDSTPSRRLARGEAVAAVLSSLARLSDDQRETVRLRFLEGQSVADVAAHLGKSEAAVHMLCHRGLKALRGLMVTISRYLTRG